MVVRAGVSACPFSRLALLASRQKRTKPLVSPRAAPHSYTCVCHSLRACFLRARVEEARALGKETRFRLNTHTCYDAKMDTQRANERVAEIARHLRSRPLPKDIDEDHQGSETCLALSNTSAQRACLRMFSPWPVPADATFTKGDVALPQLAARCLAAVLGRSRSSTSARGRATPSRRAMCRMKLSSLCILHSVCFREPPCN